MNHKNFPLLNSKVLQNALEVPQKALEYICQLCNVYFCLLRWTTKLSFLIMVAFSHLITSPKFQIWKYTQKNSSNPKQKFPVLLPQRMQTYESGHTEMQDWYRYREKSFLCVFCLFVWSIKSASLLWDVSSLTCKCGSHAHSTCSGKWRFTGDNSITAGGSWLGTSPVQDPPVSEVPPHSHLPTGAEIIQRHLWQQSPTVDHATRVSNLENTAKPVLECEFSPKQQKLKH